MIIQILILLSGLALIIFGADFLVRGSSSIARKAGVSEFVIGLTIVGMGTSAPELVVSVLGALKGNADIAVGNVVGSNIFNVFLILGATAMIMPMSITKSNIKRDIPINLAVTLLFIFLGMNKFIFRLGENSISRIDGIIFLSVFILYMIISFRHNEAPEEVKGEKTYSIPLASLMVVIGLTALIFGGNIFVDSATKSAKMLGVSDKFIAIIFLAGGTSLPEFATCVVAALKKKGQLALGNIIGSNIFNILLILGIASTIHPLSLNSMNLVDIGVLLLSSLVILASVYTGEKSKIDRADGFGFLLIEAGYLVYLFIYQ